MLIYAHEKISYDLPTIFLAGPTPRSADVKSWRPEAIRLFEQQDFPVHILIPEPRNDDWLKDYTSQIEWELKGLATSTAIMFWIPREMTTVPGMTTNIEFGMFYNSGRCILGHPQSAPHTRYLDYLADKHSIPLSFTLEETVKRTVEFVRGKDVI